ncbi:hypothetical protein TM102_33200 [Bradyrhizobium sp. TM102]|nr:hypothetical protein TM102_33200 [Bradyrhizobium sp. TM102]
MGKGAKRRAHDLARIAKDVGTLRFAHPATPPLVLPPGETSKRRVNPRAQKHSTLPKFGIVVSVRHLIPQEGRIAIVTKRGVSGGGRGLRRAGDCLVHDGRGLAYGKIVWS